MSKGKVKMYKFSDFAETQEKAVQRLLHHAHDHLLASRSLRANPIFLDSAAYICNMAFELLLKGMHLAEYGEFKRGHYLISLHNSLSKKIFAKRDIPLLKVIDKYCLVRYPIDQGLRKSQKMLRLGGHSFYPDEIGTNELEKADTLFCKTWRKLGRQKQYKMPIENIINNPYQNGTRILLRKMKQR